MEISMRLWKTATVAEMREMTGPQMTSEVH